MTCSSISRDDLQRRRILDAAGRCIAKSGFKGATVDEIASAASLSRPLIYKHFDGKEALIDAVLDTTFDEWLETHADSSETGEMDCLAQLGSKIRRSVRFAAERPVLQSILRQDPRVLVAGHAASFSRCHELSLKRTAALLEAGLRDGEVRADLDLANASQAVEMVLFALVERAIGIRADYPFSEDLMESSLEILFDGLRARPSRA
ncbi:MAG: TetR/AcrR family transcriptional regulator [bacterium]|nr:TetR/AcrR family transcriptional regulator [bacterium]